MKKQRTQATWKKTPILSILALFLLLFTSNALLAQRQMENLDRGTVAVRTSSSSVLITWRILGTEWEGVAYNIYRGTTKLNSTPITGASNYTDNTTTNSTYSIAPVVNGVEMSRSTAVPVWDTYYKSIPISAPAGGTTPTGEAYTYTANDASVGDLDGDGQYEIVLKWEPTNAKDNSQSGYTGPTYIDGLKLDGTRMWRINLGKNIRSGAHYTQFLVYDFNGDGKAEVVCKTADGTIDGAGVVLGSSTADYRNSSGYILSGPEYLSVFSGESGRMVKYASYKPARGTVSSWGDSYGNRVDRFLATVAYLDGVKPSIIMCRGYYTRMVIVAYDYTANTLTEKWTFDTNNSPYTSWTGQGNHQVSVADVDGDGKDEIIYGMVTIDDNGAGLYNSGFGHGDMLHVGDFNPNRAGLEIWSPTETGKGAKFRDAKTGAVLWSHANSGDLGRAMVADIDPNVPGAECWPIGGPLYSCTGTNLGSAPSITNSAIWWDGDLSRELLDGDKLDKWSNGTQSRLLTIYNVASSTYNNSTKKNICLQADILGDWREEMLTRNSSNTALLLFTSPYSTTHKIYTLMHDYAYRIAVASQNVAYNSPPHTSFFLGNGMATPPTPNISVIKNQGLVNGETYVISARHSGKALDVSGRSTADGANVLQYTYSGATNQKWILTDVGGGFYRLSPSHASTKALDVASCSTSSGANVQIYNYWGGSCQQWLITKNSSGYYQVASRNSKMCLDIAGASMDNSANLQQWGCTGVTCQQFLFELASTKSASLSEDAAETLSVNNGKTIMYPNPNNVSALNIDVELVVDSPITITYINASGQTVHTESLNEQPAGKVSHVSDISSLAKGIYLVRIQSGTSIEIQKLLRR
jgi:rhamnogalacturonan endolyase